MPKLKRGQSSPKQLLEKAPTGIQGLDEITLGGLPRGRPTLVCGSAGCGKTLLAVEFLVRGAMKYDEPGVFMTFEETAEELTQNVRSLGFDLDELVARNKISVDYVRVERSEIEETGQYDLEGLFVRLGHAVDSIGARRVVLDTMEVLFGGLCDSSILRAEIRRLFRWLKDRELTAVVTGERGEGKLTRHGLEEYISDCVILLDHRVTEQISTRRLRVVKYRGSTHGTNEFPFLIDANGISVLPVTSAGMDHPVSLKRVSTGVEALDQMLGGKGYFQGSSVLISGTAGTGKTSLAAHFALAACQRGERSLLFSFEEAESQLVRNLRSIGLDLKAWIDKGMLRLHSVRPTHYGLEMHLAQMHRLILDFKAQLAVVDPLSNFLAAGTQSETGSMLLRLLDHLKSRGITSVYTHLTHAVSQPQQDIGISSLIDTWLSLRDVEKDGERSVHLFVLKSRGMAHSRQVRGFHLTDRGIRLTGPSEPPQVGQVLAAGPKPRREWRKKDLSEDGR